MKTSKGTLWVTCVCLILGVIVGIQAKTVKAQSSVYDLKRVSELSAELTTLQNENKQLRNNLAEMQEKITSYEQSASAGNDSLQTIVKNLNEMKIEAGRVALTGRGITVTLNDSKKNNTSGGVDQNAFLVHAEDILSIVNELFSSGAEAISINGQRLVANSSIRCAGSVVNVNGVKIAAPFVISAIGDPDILEAALTFPGGVVDSLAPWGIELVIKKYDSVEVPAFTGTIEFKEAKAVGTESE
jgi:uncharacterized protein YlxW (UPF0749 family)